MRFEVTRGFFGHVLDGIGFDTLKIMDREIILFKDEYLKYSSKYGGSCMPEGYVPNGFYELHPLDVVKIYIRN